MLFSGSGKVSRYFKRAGFASIAFDINNGFHFDLTNPTVVSVILGWISSGCILGVCLETQCSSWSRARRGPPSSNWCAIRSNTYIYGISGLRPCDQLKVDNGNTQARNTAKIINSCIHHFVPCLMENPQTSMLWDAPCISRLCRLSLAQCQSFDMCQYNTRWRKSTKVISWHCGHELDLQRKCQGRNGICSLTHKPHIVLTGPSNVPGMLWTSLAQVYPDALARKLANKLIDASYAGRRTFLGSPVSKRVKL